MGKYLPDEPFCVFLAKLLLSQIEGVPKNNNLNPDESRRRKLNAALSSIHQEILQVDFPASFT